MKTSKRKETLLPKALHPLTTPCPLHASARVSPTLPAPARTSRPIKREAGGGSTRCLSRNYIVYQYGEKVYRVVTQVQTKLSVAVGVKFLVPGPQGE